MAGQQIRTPLPVYTAGSVAANVGSAVITGTNTNWTTQDSSGNTVNSVMGGDFFITASQAIPIKSVDSATQITLEIPLAATLNSGSSYRIIKVSPNLTGGVTTALATLQAQGSDGQADISRTIDSGAGRLKLRIGAGGDAQVAVGSSGAVDAALTTAINISTTGAVSFPKGLASIGGAPLAGFRNLIINGNFAVNQRGYASGAALAAVLTYAHDRWRSQSSNTSYTFTQATSATSSQDTSINITAGNLSQVIEPSSIAGGAYTLSWTGTSVLTVFAAIPGGSFGSPSASGSSPLVIPNIPANSSVLIQAGPGTLGIVQLEPGPVATPFERRPIGVELMLCQRYFQKSYTQSDAPGAANTTTPVQRTVDATTPYGSLGYIPFKTIMRAAPSIVLYNPKTGSTAAASNGRNIDANTDLPMSVAAVTDAGLSCLANNTSIPAGYTFGVHYTASAEL